jgi:hypothetical protein
MSVQTNTAKVQYTLSTAAQALPVTFYFLDNSHIKAVRARAGVADLTLVLGTDYTLAGAGDEAGGTLTTVDGTAAALQAGDIITIKRDISITQLTNYVYNDKFPAEVHEKVADKLTMVAQQQKEQIDRAVQFPETEVAGVGNILPSAASRAGKVFSFDANGAITLSDPITALFASGDAIQAASIAALKAVSVVGLVTGQHAAVYGYSVSGDGGDGVFKYDSASVETENSGMVVAPSVGSGRWKRLVPGGRWSVKWFGAKGDGATDDTATIFLATEWAYAQGGGLVYFPTGTYVVTRRIPASQLPAIGIRAGVSLDGMGSTIELRDNCGIIGNIHDVTGRAQITANVAKGAVQFTVDTTAALQAGDVVAIRLGDNPGDVAETKRLYFANVKTIDSSTLVTFDRGAPEALTVAGTAALNKRVIRFRASDDNAVYENQSIRNFRFTQGAGGNVEQAISLMYSRNNIIENIHAVNPGAGAILMGYAFNNRVSNVWVPESIQQSGQASKGRAINIWGSENCGFYNLRLEACQGHPIFVEGYCRGIIFENVEVWNNWLAAKGTARGATALLFVGQLSQAHFNNLYVRGRGTGEATFDDGGTVSLITFSNADFDTSEKMKFAFGFRQWVGGYLRVEGYMLRYADIKRVAVEIPYSDGWTDHVPTPIVPPTGFIVGAWYSVTDATGIGQVYITDAADVAQYIFTPGSAGTRVPITGQAAEGLYGTDYSGNTPGARKFHLYSTTITPGAKLHLEFLIATYQADDASTAMIQKA